MTEPTNQDNSNDSSQQNNAQQNNTMTEEKVRSIVDAAIKGTRSDGNADGSDGNVDDNNDYNYNRESYSQDPNYNPYASQYASQQSNYDFRYGDPRQPANEGNARLNGVESISLENRKDITFMRFKSDLDDMIAVDDSLRPYRAEAIKKYNTYADKGQIIAADTIIKLMEGESSIKKRAEERALRNTNTNDTGFEPGGATKPKHPMEMTAEEIEKNFGNIPF